MKDSLPHLLRAEEIEKHFSDRLLFQDLSLSLSKGESVSIMGRSGEGKSTLLHILSGIEPPSKGEIFFKDNPFSKLDLNRIRNRSFGFLFQAFHLLDERDVLSNVLTPVIIARWPKDHSKEEWEDKARTLLRRMNIIDLERKRASTLSGGERQRVALARALIMSPEILFLDEPTGNLDKSTADEIISLLFSFFSEGVIQSILLVTHDPALASLCSSQYMLTEGKLKLVNS